MSNEGMNEPLIIRRRRSDSEEEHHGGVWKLAFADFMTAMMAFFLVMWLINSTSKETKATIVQYFNPVQLVDSSPARKGLRDPKEGGQGSSIQHNEDVQRTKAKTGPQDAEAQEAALFKDPIKTLNEIAKIDAPKSASPPTAAPASHALADPFDRVDESAFAPEAGAEANGSSQARDAGVAADKARTASETKGGGAAADLAASLRAALDKALREEGEESQGRLLADVRQTEDGVLISLTDNANFSMFDVGSFKPNPQAVRILAQLGPLLAKHRGDIEISGHTDARSYRSKSYDNWRLSSDRANLVNYMLVRGGLPAARVAKISGFADHRLKNPKDPLAAVNRRIEILIRRDKS